MIKKRFIKVVKVGRRKSASGSTTLVVTLPAEARRLIGDPEYMACELIEINGTLYVAYRPIKP